MSTYTPARKRARLRFKEKRRLAWRERVCGLKEKTPCADCGNCFPAVCMDFDHINGDKVDNIAKMVHAGTSMQIIEAEISKCEIVCANCHRIRTRDRQLLR